MKKTFIMMSMAVLAALVSCNKEETPAATDTLEFISSPSETTIAKEGTDSLITVTFKSTKDWTASVDAEFATISPKSGVAADECKVKINVEANETESDRSFTLTVSAEGLAPLTITFNQQSLSHMNIEPREFTVTKEGGEFTVNVDANVNFEVKDYNDGSFPWQKATLSEDKKSVKVVIDANPEYDARQSYVKFTTPDIQVDVIGEDGSPTGETEDLVVRVYFNQEGLAEIVWNVVLPEAFKDGLQLSMAKFAGMYLVFDGVTPMLFNPVNGEFGDASSLIPSGANFTVAEAVNDDAGNLILSTTTSFGEVFDVYVVPAGSQSLEAIQCVIHSYFDYYGYGMGHISAKGNVLEDGIITALIADGPSAGVPVTGAYWEIEDGKATTWAKYGDTEEETCQPEYIEIPTDGEIWIANRAAFAPVGTSAAEGFIYNGYDGTYSTQYFIGTNTYNLATIGDWMNGVSAITSSNGLIAINNMSWFPQWGPSYLMLFTMDSTGVQPIANISLMGEGLEGIYMAEPSTCILIEKDEVNNGTVIYSADGSQGLLTKIFLSAK